MGNLIVLTDIIPWNHSVPQRAGGIDSISNDSELFSFGQYATLTRDNGIRADGLALMSNLLLPLLVKNPTARFTETEFKCGIAAALAAKSARKVPTTKTVPEL